MLLPIPPVHEAFLLSGSPMPNNFIFAVQVSGIFSTEDLRSALLRVCERHPLARTRISSAPDGTPCLDSQDVPEIPLRVVENCASEDWQAETLAELGQPFEFTGPFVRLVRLINPTGSDLLVVFNHKICDGMSGAHFTRDFLRLLGDPQLRLEALPPIPGSAYDHLPAAVREDWFVRLQQTILSKAAHLAWPLINKLPVPALPTSPPPTRRFFMVSGVCSPEQTAALLERCRAEKTTLHAVWCAAWLRADAELSLPLRWRRSVSSPFSLRSSLVPPVGDNFGLFMGMSTASVDCHPRHSIWEVARRLNRSLKRQTAAGHQFDWLLRTHAAISGLSPAQRREVIGVLSARPPDYDLAITNLGRLDFPAQCGALKVDGLRGPLVNGFPWERTVSLVTFDGRLSYAFIFRDFVLTSHQAERIRARALQILAQAAAWQQELRRAGAS